MTALVRPTPLIDMLAWLEQPLKAVGSPHFIRVEDFVRDGRYVVRADLPGVNPDEDIQLEIRGDVLSIRAERRQEKAERGHHEVTYGSFTRSLRLPDGCRDVDITATYDAGVLEVSVPLAEVPAPVRVPIQQPTEG